MQLLHNHRSIIYALAFSPDGVRMLSGARDGSLYESFSDGGYQAIIVSETKSPSIHDLTFLDDTEFAIAHAHGWQHFRQENLAWLATLPIGPPCSSIARVTDSLLAIGFGERSRATAGRLELFNLESKRSMKPLFTEPNGVRAISTCLAKSRIAWSTGHKKVSIWDIRKQDPTHISLTHNSPSLALSPNGLALAVASDWNVRVFDLEKREELANFRGHKGIVSSVAFSPDGGKIASGSWDQSIRLWEYPSGCELADFRWPIGKVTALCFAPDGLRLAAGGEDGAVVVWDLD